MEEKMVFKPRPSMGWFSLLLLALIIIGVGVSAVVRGGTSQVIGAFFILLGIYFALLAVWWPTMRYELDREALTLVYGQAIKYRILLESIKSMKRVDLPLSLWSSMRLPGVALFTVPYADLGPIKMCSTAALNGIFLVETDHGFYGLTPEEEDHLAAAVQARMRR
jgi:hypothetical protein